MNQVSPGAAGELLPPTASEPQHKKKGFSPGDYVERLALVIAWLVVIVVFSILAPDTFFNVRNFTTMFSTQTTLVILALALLIPLTAGDYDISVAATLTFSGMVVAVLNAQHGVPIGLAIAIAIAAGALIGLINGFFIIFFEIDAFIVTLGTGTIILGLTLWISASQTISGVSDWLSSWVVVHRLFGISYEFFYGLLLCIFLWYVFDYTAIGRRILFVGRGTNVARLSGIRVGRVRWGCFVAAGIIAAAAGVLYTGTAGASDPNVRPDVPASRVRRGIPRQHGDHAGPLQPLGHLHRRVLPRHRHHRPGDPRRSDLGAERVLRGCPGRRAVGIADRQEASRARCPAVTSPGACPGCAGALRLGSWTSPPASSRPLLVAGARLRDRCSAQDPHPRGAPADGSRIVSRHSQ